MTRGILALIDANKKVYSSGEFNGGMYIKNGYGEDAINILKNVNTLTAFENAVKVFNQDIYKKYRKEDDMNKVYDLNKLYDMNTEDILDFSKGWVRKWGCDFLFIKNISQEDVEVIQKNKNKIVIKAGEVIAFRYGQFEK